jgi:hypothetical protein
MRKSIIAFWFLIPVIAAAAPLKGTITVKLDDGEIRTYPADEYVVVKRRPYKKVIVTPTPPSHKPEPVIEVVTLPPKKNRVRLVGGIGPNAVSVDGGPQTYTVSTAERFVAGVGYNRLVSGPWSIDAQAITNKTFTLGVGFDF